MCLILPSFELIFALFRFPTKYTEKKKYEEKKKMRKEKTEKKILKTIARERERENGRKRKTRFYHEG